MISNQTFLCKGKNYIIRRDKLQPKLLRKFIELYVYNCEWINKEECYYIQIHAIPFVSNGGLVALQNLSKIQKEMTSFVWNLNQICSFAPLRPEENNKFDSGKNVMYLKVHYIFY